jgi:DNA-binding transcriptional ArsR family regulator
MKQGVFSEMENLFLALSDRTRLQLLNLMGSNEVSVGFLCNSLGQSQPKISRHLAYLRSSGLVSTRRDGKWIFYRIEPPAELSVQAVLAAAVGWTALSQAQSLPDMPEQVENGAGTHAIEEEVAWIPNELAVHLL